MPIDAYIKEKLQILNELKIELTWRQRDHLWSLTTEFDVDAFAHDLIMGTTKIK